MTDKKLQKSALTEMMSGQRRPIGTSPRPALSQEERMLEAARQSDNQQDDWENEGGALATEAKQTTEHGHERPVPKREDFSGNLTKDSEPERD